MTTAAAITAPVSELGARLQLYESERLADLDARLSETRAGRLALETRRAALDAAAVPAPRPARPPASARDPFWSF